MDDDDEMMAQKNHHNIHHDLEKAYLRATQVS